MKRLNNKKGQGTTEYIIVIGIAVAIAVGILWTKLQTPLQTKVGQITTGIASINVNGN